MGAHQCAAREQMYPKINARIVRNPFRTILAVFLPTTYGRHDPSQGWGGITGGIGTVVSRRYCCVGPQSTCTLQHREVSQGIDSERSFGVGKFQSRATLGQFDELKVKNSGVGLPVP